MAQEQSGFLPSNYAGVNSLFINPSNMVDSKIFIDFHLIGLHAFLHNNTAYIPKKNISYKPGQTINVLINEKDVKKKAFAKIEAIGPSAAVSWGIHSFGVFTRLRTYLDAAVSDDLAYLAIKKFDYTPYIGSSFKEKAHLSTATWFETGVSYGRMFIIGNYKTLNVGGNIKRLKAINASALTLKDFDYTVDGVKDLQVNHAEGSYRLVEPGWGIGKGWAIDAGVNYQYKVRDVSGYLPNTKKNGCKNIDYKYKIGLSVMDLGYLNIKSNAFVKDIEYNAQQFDFDSASINTFGDFDRFANTNVVNNAVSQTNASKFKTMLPFALSAQADYNFENGLYLNATLLTSFKIRNQPKRVSVLAFTPRYERKYFEIAMPVSFVGFTYPQLGLSIRLGNWIIIGTDRLDSFRGKIRNVYGADIYFHIKYALFQKCKKRKAKFAPVRHCPAYNTR